MKPTSISNQNCTYGKGQPEYVPLPARKTEDGIVSTCWKMSLGERLTVLLTGKIFLHVLTFNKPLQPTRLTTHDQRTFRQVGPKVHGAGSPSGHMEQGPVN